MTIQGRTNPGAEDDLRQETQRERWISQHSLFLSKAMSGQIKAPRIPRRRVDRGGFTMFLGRPGVRELMSDWWTRVLDAGTLDP